MATDIGSMMVTLSADISNLQAGLSEAQSSISSFTGMSAGQMAMLGTAIAGVGVATGYMFLDMAKDAAVAADVEANFNKMVEKGPALLEKMNAELLGTKSNMDLMSIANLAAVRGVDTEMLPSFSEFAMKLSDVNPMFKDTTASINEITSAIATSKPGKLKDMGIIVDLGKAQEDYAMKAVRAENDVAKAKGEAYWSDEKLNEIAKERVKNMSDVEKRMINSITIQDAVNVKNKEMVEPTRDLNDIIAALKVGWDNLSVTIGTALLPILEPLGIWLLNAVKWIQDVVKEHTTFVIVLGIVTVAVALLAGALLLVGAAMMIITVPALIVTGIIIGIIAVIVAIVIAIIYLKKNWEIIWTNIKIFLANIWNGILEIIEGGVNALIKPFSLLIDAYNVVARKMNWEQLKPQVDLTSWKIDTKSMETDLAKLKEAKVEAGVSEGTGILAKAKALWPGATGASGETKIINQDITINNPATIDESVENIKLSTARVGT